MFYKNLQTYVQGSNICLALKGVQYKPYVDLQSLPILIHNLNNLLIYFITSLAISTNCKRDSYDTIFLVIPHLTKIVDYEPIKTMIDISSLVKIIIIIVMKYYGLFWPITSDQDSLFIPKFRSLLCYFFDIKQKLCTLFHL